MTAASETVARVEALTAPKYKYGFVTDIESDVAPRGLSEDTIRFISAKKGEPTWLLEWRLKAYRHWLTLTEPDWAKIKHPPIDYQNIAYYSAPKAKAGPQNLDEVDPALLKTYEKLGIPLYSRKSWPASSGAWLWMPCLTACLWRRRTRTALRNTASFSVR